MIVAAFDADPNVVGSTFGNLTVEPMNSIPATVAARDIKIGIVAVPAAHAQQVMDSLVAAGIKAILNYAPYAPQVPDGVKVRGIDPVLALQSMTYYLKR
jgi:redox-sensing transcriptional repressor